MHAALTAADLTDGSHPTAGGYDKMAATWYAAMRSVPGNIGEPGSTGTTPTPVGAASGPYLDVPGGNTANGTQPIIWDCNGDANQQWTLNSDGTVRGVQSGLCLDVDHNVTANGTSVLLWTCTAAANQQWSRN
jgi:hypothetical protein